MNSEKISFLYQSAKHELSDWSHNFPTFSFTRLMFLGNDFFIMSWKTTRFSFYKIQTIFYTSIDSQLVGAKAAIRKIFKMIQNLMNNSEKAIHN